MAPVLLLAATTAVALAAVAYRRVTGTRARLLAYLREAAPEVVVTRLTPLGFVAHVLGVPVEVDVASLLRRRPRGPEAARFAQILADVRSRLPVPAPPPLSLVQDRIMPLLRPQADADLFVHYPAPVHLVARPLVEGVVVTYVIGGTDTYTAITRGVLEAWGLSVEALHALAIENLRRHTQHVLAEIGGPRTRYEHLDRYDATRVLVADLVTPADIPDAVLAIPEETVLLVAPVAQARALATEAAALHAASSRPLTPTVFRLASGGRLVRYAFRAEIGNESTSFQ